MKPMRQMNTTVTRSQLEKKANEHGLTIRKDGQGNFMLIDIQANTVAAYPATMTWEQVEQWLNDLDAQNEE